MWEKWCCAIDHRCISLKVINIKKRNTPCLPALNSNIRNKYIKLSCKMPDICRRCENYFWRNTITHVECVCYKWGLSCLEKISSLYEKFQPFHFRLFSCLNLTVSTHLSVYLLTQIPDFENEVYSEFLKNLSKLEASR